MLLLDFLEEFLAGLGGSQIANMDGDLDAGFLEFVGESFSLGLAFGGVVVNGQCGSLFGQFASRLSAEILSTAGDKGDFSFEKRHVVQIGSSLLMLMEVFNGRYDSSNRCGVPGSQDV